MSIAQDEDRFSGALQSIGLDPQIFKDKKIDLEKLSSLYPLSQNQIFSAIKDGKLLPCYDGSSDTLWFSALEFAYFYYCEFSRQKYPSKKFS